jgi:hypothetical protein
MDQHAKFNVNAQDKHTHIPFMWSTGSRMFSSTAAFVYTHIVRCTGLGNAPLAWACLVLNFFVLLSTPSKKYTTMPCVRRSQEITICTRVHYSDSAMLMRLMSANEPHGAASWHAYRGSRGPGDQGFNCNCLKLLTSARCTPTQMLRTAENLTRARTCISHLRRTSCIEDHKHVAARGAMQS